MARYRRQYGRPPSSPLPTRLEGWKLDAQRAWKTDCPNAPLPSPSQRYTTVFGSVQMQTSGEFMALDDWALMIAGTHQPKSLNFGARLETCAPFPTPPPMFSAFPPPPEPAERQPVPGSPTWTQRLFGIADAVRSNIADASAFNQWAVATHAELLSEWTRRHDAYDATCEQRRAEWSDSKGQWDEAHRRDLERWAQLLLGYKSGEAEAVATYFRVCLERVALPRWSPMERALFYEPTEAILLIQMQLPFLRDLPVMKARELKVGAKMVAATKSEAADIRRKVSFFLPLRLRSRRSRSELMFQPSSMTCNALVHLTA